MVEAMQITAAVARAINTPFTVETLSLEEPRFDEVLVRLVATGICHTDISMRDHKIYPVPHPVVLGHERAGIVEEPGAAATKVPAPHPATPPPPPCPHPPTPPPTPPTHSPPLHPPHLPAPPPP